MRPSRAFILGVAASWMLACTHLKQLALGPATRIGDGRPASWGGALVGETVVGNTSSSGGFGGLGAGARGAVTGRSIDVAPFGGVHFGSSGNRTFFDASLRLGPGLQWLEGRPLGFASFGSSLGFGYALSDTGWRDVPPWPIPWAQPAGLRRVAPPRTERERSRVLLQVGLAADLDVRFTRGPMLIPFLFVGLAWLDEVAWH